MKVDPEKLAALEWIEEAMKLDAWQKFWSNLEKETGEMKEHAMVVGSEPTMKQDHLLKMCGLSAPKTPEEIVQTFLCFRAVVSFVSNKQALMAANRDIYRQGVESLREQGDLPEPAPQVNLKKA